MFRIFFQQRNGSNCMLVVFLHILNLLKRVTQFVLSKCCCCRCCCGAGRIMWLPPSIVFCKIGSFGSEWYMCYSFASTSCAGVAHFQLCRRFDASSRVVVSGPEGLPVFLPLWWWRAASSLVKCTWPLFSLRCKPQQAAAEASRAWRQLPLKRSDMVLL